MKLREKFISKAAVGVLALGLAPGIGAVAFAADDNAAKNVAQSSVSTTTGPVVANPLSVKNDERKITARSVETDPLIPVGLIVGLGGLCGVLCLIGAKRRMKGAWLRAAAGATLVVTLVNPEILVENRDKLPAEVVIVVDKSASQTLGGRDKMTSDMQEALVRQLSQTKGVEVRIVEAAGAKKGLAADGTDLFAALDATLADIPRDRLGAVIMLTDGQVHDIPARYQALGKGVPLHVLVSGHEGERDRRVVIDGAPRFGLIGKDEKITFHVQDDGVSSAPDAKVRVTVSEEGKQIATRLVTPGEKVEVNVGVNHAGANLVEIKTEALDGELTAVNNRAVVPVEGVREHMNVLFISGAPNDGVRMWRDLLKSDPDVNLVHFTTLRPAEKQDFTPLNELSLIPIPTNKLFSEMIDTFDLIVFDHYDYRVDSMPAVYFENIADHVKTGGALLVVSGPEYAGGGSLYNTPLSPLLPAVPTGQIVEAPFKPQLSDLGKRHPVTRGLAGSETTPPHWGDWFQQVDAGNSGGQAVMEGAGRKPLLILNRQDKGRVAVLLSDSAPRWRYGNPGGPSADLLERVSRWLLKDPGLEEETLRLNTQDGNLIVEEQTLGSKPAPVTVHTPSGGTQTVTLEQAGPGLWRATLPADELGLYSADERGPHPATAFASAGPENPKEFINTLSTTALLKPVADATGGSVGRMTVLQGSADLSVPRIVVKKPDAATDQKMAGDGWIGIRGSEASVLQDAQKTPIIPPWLGFLLAVGFMAGAWQRESETPLFRKKEQKDKGGPTP